MAVNIDGSSTYFNISQPVYNKCLSTIQKAQATWILMVAEFAAENLALGITSDQALKVSAALNEVMFYGSEGSLHLAYEALSRVQVTDDMVPFLTADRIQWMRNKMIQVMSSL
jgi:hypothetical protein